MQFTREQIATGVVIGLLAGGAVALWVINRRAEEKRAAGPEWLNVHQPPDGVASGLQVVTPERSWAANRCLPMVACCPQYSAGSRVRKIYPESLAASEHSIVRAGFLLQGGL